MHLHYYFYFMDARSSASSTRPHLGTVPPAILQRSQLAGPPSIVGGRIAFTAAADNAFVPRIDDWQRARELADALSPDLLHRARPLRGPVLSGARRVRTVVHWSLMQVEYATDWCSVPPPH